MAGFFYAGQRVVCTKRDPWTGDDDSAPVFGSEYTVRDVIYQDGEVGLRLEEIRNPGGYAEPAFLSENFRPVSDEEARR